uniref:C-type lectin domain-containing protein n=1 Tax=Panagrolaimus superbus TaxID=310955 RepID=A0A914Z531_9BILA
MLFFGISLLISTFVTVNSESPVPEIILASNPCPKGWTYVSQINQCYIIPKIFLPWSDAQAYCQNVTGGELVSVYSQFEYDTLLSWLYIFLMVV